MMMMMIITIMIIMIMMIRMVMMIMMITIIMIMMMMMMMKMTTVSENDYSFGIAFVLAKESLNKIFCGFGKIIVRITVSRLS